MMKWLTLSCVVLGAVSAHGQGTSVASKETAASPSESDVTDPVEAPVATAKTAAVASTSAPFTARQTAHLLPAGVSQWGIFGPYARGLKGGYELELRPLVFTLMASPNAVLRKSVHAQGLWTVAAEGGLSIPTLGMKMWQGGEDNPLPLPVSLYGRGDTIPWILVPRVGLIASHGTQDADLLTLRADLTMAVPLGDGDFNATEHWLLGLLLAPVDTGYRARLGVAYDRPIHERIRLQTSIDLYAHGAQPDSMRVLGKVGVEFAAWRAADGRWRRIGLGLGVLNSDTYAVNAERQRVRSNDIFPLFDIVF